MLNFQNGCNFNFLKEVIMLDVMALICSVLLGLGILILAIEEVK